jgi:Uncharacterized conserved protein (some members contain a von Willebrand factor type A (vWA) domain)
MGVDMEILALLCIVLIIIWLQKNLVARYIFHNLSYNCSFSKADAFEGDEIQLTEIVHNNKPLPLQWLKVEIYTSKWLSFANTKSVIAQESRFVTSGYSLGKYQKTTRIWKVKCQKRGVYKTENVTLVGGDFLGVLTHSIPTKVELELVVYPGTVCLEEILVSAERIMGETVVRRWFIDDPFFVSGARKYTPGDPLKRIHWMATARQGSLMVRNYDFTAQRDVQVILNIQSMEYGPTIVVHKEIIELGIRIAATIFERYTDSGIPIGLITNGCTPDYIDGYLHTVSSSGAMHLTALLTTLAQLELKKTLEFEDCLDNLLTHVVGSEAVIITAFLSNSLCNRINRLKMKCDRVKVILLDRDYNKGCLDNDIELLLVEL